MNLTSYKRRRLRQKPNILTIEQSRELGQLAGIKSTKNVADKGLVSIYQTFKLSLFIIHVDSNQLIPAKEAQTRSYLSLLTESSIDTRQRTCH
jgi:hypothetical protein